MYAVIKSGGKQHKVSEGEEILLEKISVEEGKNVEFSEVLAVNKDGKLDIHEFKEMMKARKKK